MGPKLMLEPFPSDSNLPTTEQKKLFQHAFSIVCLAKRETYKLIGPNQHLGISMKRMLEINRLITSEYFHDMEHVNLDDEEDKRKRIAEKRD